MKTTPEYDESIRKEQEAAFSKLMEHTVDLHSVAGLRRELDALRERLAAAERLAQLWIETANLQSREASDKCAPAMAIAATTRRECAGELLSALGQQVNKGESNG